MQNDPLISIRDLHVSFGPVEVLHGIDLDIEQGVIHALIGESGSGKSVLARSIWVWRAITAVSTAASNFKVKNC